MKETDAASGTIRKELDNKMDREEEGNKKGCHMAEGVALRCVALRLEEAG